MRYINYYFVYYFVTVHSTGLSTKYCDLQSNDITKQCFVKETLASLPHSPNQLAVDRSSNILYFSFDIGQGEYIPATLRIDTKKVTVLKGVKDAFAVAANTATGDIYFGGSHGIYKYNRLIKVLKRLSVSNLDIWWLFIKNYVYFIKFPSLSAFYYQNKALKPVPQLKSTTVHQFVIDKDDNTIFINGTGLFSIKNDSNIATLLKNSPKFFGMSINSEGHVYVCSEDGIFVISEMFQKVKRIINIQGVLGFTFDKHNNIIYTDSHELIRLLPVNNNSAIRNLL
ncbi:ommochrome-binding protein-like [Galleria mellonella]|uniref:Ommochrome-binding protein-like n=1 Tax=Galleria mellonella TaxID=7137 RepID=A0A6J1WZ63_GALME|nr:ommochrome-binding protein-like [Galleria mellonella]